jgi:hypothetical protein
MMLSSAQNDVVPAAQMKILVPKNEDFCLTRQVLDLQPFSFLF